MAHRRYLTCSSQASSELTVFQNDANHLTGSMLAVNTRLPVEEAPHPEQLLQCCVVTAMRYGMQQGAAHAGSRTALCGTSCCSGSALVRPQ